MWLIFFRVYIFFYGKIVIACNTNFSLIVIFRPIEGILLIFIINCKFPILGCHLLDGCLLAPV